jgi:ABC-type transport system involved in multi-copper enzyme maturation permease subunit
MEDIITIAQSTFYRVARLKALYVILVICVLDVAAMSAYKELSMGLEKELVFDCALAISLVVGLITSMVAAFEIPRELREKTAQFILSKPMGRSAFIWGKFLGVSALAVFNVAFIIIGSLLAYRLSFGETNWGLLSGGILVASEAVTLTSLGLLLSIFLTDTLAAIGLFAFFVIGHCVFMIERWSGGNILGNAAYYLLPNFYNCDVKTELSHGVDVPGMFVGMGAVYGIAYAFFVTGLAIIIFNRKDIA